MEFVGNKRKERKIGQGSEGEEEDNPFVKCRKTERTSEKENTERREKEGVL